MALIVPVIKMISLSRPTPCDVTDLPIILTINKFVNFCLNFLIFIYSSSFSVKTKEIMY